MSETRMFALLVLVAAGVGLLAVLSNRLAERVKVPLPAFFLAGAAIARLLIDDVHAPPQRTLERVVTIALLLILFDGGQHIGFARFRRAAGPIVIVGVAGTFLTVAVAALVAHLAFGLDWFPAVLVATAVAPTDPAIVFSVLGQREIAGRSSTILEGESGVNDPVGIALMASLIAAGGLGLHAFATVGERFLLEMFVGAAVGLLGARGVLLLMRRVTLPGEALYPLQTLAGVLALFGIATLLHGSGFLAVFVAGIALGNEQAPYKREIERFHSALASLGEIVAFVILGLTVDVGVLGRTDVWIPGLVLGVLLALVIRPLVVGFCLIPARLHRSELAFVLFAGLKGAVPILLGSFIVAAHVAESARLYGIVIVVVIFSVVAQGTLVPTVAALLKLPMRTVEPEPWALGVRLRHEPDNVHRLVVAEGAPVDGTSLATLQAPPGEVWVSFIVRDFRLVEASPDTVLSAGDEVLVLADRALEGELAEMFGRAAPARD